VTQPPEQPPVFVIGNPRSGTTMFRLALTAHRSISIPPENPFLVKLFDRFGRIKSFQASQLDELFDAMSAKPVSFFDRWEMDQGTVRDLLAQSEGCTFSEIGARLYQAYPKIDGAESFIWGDKNTSYFQYVDILSWLYPNAKFIHLVRDGRAVLASYQALNKRKKENENVRFPVLPSHPIIAASRWLNAVQTIERAFSKMKPENCITVRYEDVVGDFENQLTRVCEFLNISYETNMKDFHKLNEKFGLEPRKYDSWKWRTREPITAQRVDDWKKSLSDSDVSSFETVAKGQLNEFGYDLLSGDSSFSWSDRFTWLKESSCLRWRKKMRHCRFLLQNLRASRNAQ
jgi:hypothetical protein